MPEDNEQSTESQYLLSRQVAHEWNSPFMDGVRRIKAETAEAEAEAGRKKAKYEKGKQAYVAGEKARGKSEKVVQESFGELEEPMLDPTMAFAGGAGGMFKLSMSAGMKLMPSLGRAVTSGVVGAAADYPIGATSEVLEVKAPKLALPFNLAVGLISGVTLENAIERSVFKLAQKAGKEVTKEAMSAQVKQIKGILANESGEIKLGKGYDKETHKAVVDEINKEIGEVPISKVREAEQKEPWQLTKAEYDATQKPMTSKKGPGEIPTKKDLVSPEGGKVIEPWEHKTPKAYRIARRRRFKDKKDLSEWPSGYEKMIAEAFVEGKPIPKDVRNQYGLPEKVPIESVPNVSFIGKDLKNLPFVVPKILSYLRTLKGVARNSKLLPKVYKATERAIYNSLPNAAKGRESDLWPIFTRNYLDDDFMDYHSKLMDENYFEVIDSIIKGFKKDPSRIYRGKPGSFLKITLQKDWDAFQKEDWIAFKEGVLKDQYKKTPEGRRESLKVIERDKKDPVPKPSRSPLEGGRMSHREVIQKALSEGKPVPESILKEYPVKPIPEFKTTGEAVKFGKTATKAEITELKKLRQKTTADQKAKLQKSSDVAYKAQLYNEAIQASEGRSFVKRGVPKLKKPIKIGEFLKAQPDIVKKLSKSGEFREFAGNINLSRVENAEQLSAIYGKTVAAFKKELGEATRGYRSNKRTEEAAEMLGMTPGKLLKRRKGQAFNAEEATAARFMLASSADNLSALAKKVQTLEATDINKFEFQKALNLHYAIQAQVQGMTAEAGRALQAFRVPAKTEAFKIKQIGDVLKSMPEGVSPEKMAGAISTMDDVGKLTNFTRNVQRATTKDMFLEAWINGLLSGPQTHAVNTMSNTLTAMWQVPERLLAGVIGRVTPGPQAIKEAEAIRQAFGLVEGFKDGIKLFTKTMVTGEPSDALSKIELKRYRSITAENIKQLPAIKKLAPNALEEGGMAARTVDFLGAGVRLPGRALMAEDELFKAIGYRMELNAQAYRMATNEGLKGKDLAKRIAEIKSDPETLAPNVHAAAVDASRYQTFTKPLESKLLQSLSKTDSAALRVIVPFIRTPTNIVKFAFERTPLAPFMKSVRADIAAGGAAKDLALARISLGSMTMATVAALAAGGQVTGGGPSNSKLKSHLYNQGWQPYSVKIGDQYYAYGRLEPMGMLFGIAADATEIMGQISDDERDKLASMIVGAISKNVTSKTWLRGVSDALEALNDPDRYGEQWTRRLSGTVIPTGVAQVERVMSPEMEAVNSYLDQIKSRIPGYSETLPVRRNLWSEPIILGGGLGPDIISPIYTSKKVDSPVDKELFELKAPLSMPNKTQQIRGIPVKLTPQEYDDYIILMNKVEVHGGKNLKESLNQLIKHDKRYKKMSDDRKIERIRAYFNEAKDKAKDKLYEKNPEIQEYIEMERQNVQ